MGELLLEAPIRAAFMTFVWIPSPILFVFAVRLVVRSV
jgi:hypothetical protein